jgi:hypothetical protein
MNDIKIIRLFNPDICNLSEQFIKLDLIKNK